MRHLVCLVLCVCALAASAEAADRTVCASGCAYSNLQTAINEAAAGDTILLRAGQTFTGNFTLKAKGGTSFITIKSDAPASSLPPAGVRLIPEGKPGANTARSALARLVGNGGTYAASAVIRAEPGAHHYRLQALEIDGVNGTGEGTMIDLGANNSSQTTASAAPYAIVIDRVWVHGSAVKGARRGIAVNSRSTDVLNSYVNDIFAMVDAQAIAGYNGPGPIRLVNNYLEGAAENVLFGGADPKIPNLVPSDIEIRGNHFSKKLSWKNPVLSAPGTPTATGNAGGSLAAGTHYFKVVAVLLAGISTVTSAPSTEVSATVGSAGAVQLSWPAVANAEKYRVYRGTAPNGESVYTETTARSLTYSGAGEKAGTPPTAGKVWAVKNLLELKNAQRVLIDGNLFEYSWKGGQDGTAILFTPRNQENTAPWSVVREVTFSNNLVRHIGNGVNILGRDYNATSQQTRDIRILNNVFEDLGGTHGAGKFLVMTSGAANITVDHNTLVHTGPVGVIDGPAVLGFVYTNNFSRHNTSGLYGAGKASGLQTLAYYFPGYVMAGNVLAGGKASSYPAGNYFPTVAEFDASFVHASGGDYSLASSSPYNNKATDGKDVGVDMGALALAQSAQVTTPNSTPPPSPTPTPPPPTPTPTPPPPVGTLPGGWQSEDIGAVSAAGSADESGGVFTVKGEGTDIWGTADEFHFAYRPLSGNGSIVARVASLTGVAAWTKAGVMIRANSTAGSAQALMLVSVGKGTAFQRRRTNGGTTTSTAGDPGVAPLWVRLTRAGNTISAYSSKDGAAWKLVASDTFTMPADVLVGLAVNGHDVLATAAFDNVAIAAGEALPSGWSAADVGAVGKAGNGSLSAGTFTVRGAGADVWGTADALHFVSRTLDGDGEIVARVASISGTQAWTKVGVMMRQTLDAGSAQAMMIVSTGKGLAFQRRTVTGGLSAHTAGGAGSAPKWVKLARAGTVITASVSSDGVAWQVVGSDTFSIVGPIYVGLAVSSHDVTALATATFDNVTVRP
jgi:regulation of enolase protein 1 (concanavalin A-like superfamily)